MNSLSVIVPYYNEEAFLEKSIKRLLKIDIAKNIFLVNDGSTDNSKMIALNLAKNFNNIHCIDLKVNNGKGCAVSSLKSKIDTSHIVIHDADMEYNPEDLINLFNESKKNKNSLILGSRFLGKQQRENKYLRTFLANKFLSALFSIIHFYKVTDVATCYKLFPTQFYENETFTEKGFAIEIEILSKFLKYNKSIKEVPISYSGRTFEEGKKINYLDGIDYIYKIIKYRILN